MLRHDLAHHGNILSANRFIGRIRDQATPLAEECFLQTYSN